MSATKRGSEGAVQLGLCWALAAAWLVAFLFSQVHAGSPSGTYAGAVQGLLMVLVVVMHGRLAYGWKGLSAYVVIIATVAFSLESCSIATGFPFGFFTHNLAGPKPLGVPIPVVMGYVVLGWFGWTLARLIVRADPAKAIGLDRFTTPIVASFVLAGFDYPYDPIGSAVLNMFAYRHPSGQFGVPLTNYLGWLFAGWVFFQLFALVESRFGSSAVARRFDFWLLPCLMWLGVALQYPILFAAAPAGTVERGGRSFMVADIYEAAVAGCLFTMVLPALIALIRLNALRNAGANSSA